MYILVVDDDYLQADWVVGRLKRFFPNSKIEVMETEQEFRSRLGELSNHPPDVIIMDVMLRWTSPSAEMPNWPKDVEKEGFYSAGFRCEKLLSGNDRLKHVPLIFYTVLERADLEREYEFVPGSKMYLQKPGRAYLRKPTALDASPPHQGSDAEPNPPDRAYLRKESAAEPLVYLIRELTQPR